MCVWDSSQCNSGGLRPPIAFWGSLKVAGTCDEVAAVGAGRVGIVRSDLVRALNRFAGSLQMKVCEQAENAADFLKPFPFDTPGT
jgi:hypothetical protein